MKAEPPKRSIWSGRISIGLVNVPVKLYTMIRDNSISFRFLHKADGAPLKYQKVCTLDKKIVANYQFFKPPDCQARRAW